MFPLEALVPSNPKHKHGRFYEYSFCLLALTKALASELELELDTAALWLPTTPMQYIVSKYRLLKGYYTSRGLLFASFIRS